MGRSNSAMRLILAPLKDPSYHRKSLPWVLPRSCQQESNSQDSERNAHPISSLLVALISASSRSCAILPFFRRPSLHLRVHTRALCGDTGSWDGFSSGGAPSLALVPDHLSQRKLSACEDAAWPGSHLRPEPETLGWGLALPLMHDVTSWSG